MKKGISGYTIIRNGIELDYCFKEAVFSLIPICNEVVICDSDSTDGTKEALFELEKLDSRVRVINRPWDDPVGRETCIVEWINFTRERLHYDHQLQLDGDEVLSESSYPRVLEASKTGESLWFKRFNFWNDAQHLIPSGRTCGDAVVRFGPTNLWMVSDEPHPEGEPEIRRVAVKDESLKIFHYGFIRKQKPFIKKARVMLRAFFNSYDDRLVSAEKSDKPWQEFCIHDRPYVKFKGAHPKVALDWLRERGHQV